MKKIIILLGLFVLVPLAIAIEEGQNVTQQQLDGFDTTTIDKTFLQCQNEGIFLTQNFLMKEYSCLNLREHGSDYLVFRQDYQASINLITLRDCVLGGNGVITCVQQQVQSMRNQRDSEIEATKDFVIQHQSIGWFAQLRTWLENFDLFA